MRLKCALCVRPFLIAPKELLEKQQQDGMQCEWKLWDVCWVKHVRCRVCLRVIRAFRNVLLRTPIGVCVAADVADLFALPRANGPIGRPTYTRSQNRTCT